MSLLSLLIVALVLLACPALADRQWAGDCALFSPCVWGRATARSPLPPFCSPLRDDAL